MAGGESSIDGLARDDHPTNPWTRVAQILLAGKYYE